VKTLLYCGLILVAIAIVLLSRAIRSRVGVPTHDDPKNVTPPPARDLAATERRNGPS
jgi:hypothetical protein